jgi:hypothetical protein
MSGMQCEMSQVADLSPTPRPQRHNAMVLPRSAIFACGLVRQDFNACADIIKLVDFLRNTVQGDETTAR